MIDLLELLAFHADYADTIDSDRLEEWPEFFAENTLYVVTHIENIQEGLPAGVMYADTRAMLDDRVAALRQANVYERQRYRHIIGLPKILQREDEQVQCRTPFVVVRTMASGDVLLFASGYYEDRLVRFGSAIKIKSRQVVCDSTAIDTLMVLPL
jgi:3-phenylpropionate/cinnamic acid dioxygenase small subunit